MPGLLDFRRASISLALPMSLAAVHSRALRGLEAPEVTVEVHLANGLPSFTLVGLAETEVKESRERVRAALQTSGLEFPHNKRVTVNLAPADLPKESGRFDLPIALGILAAAGQIDAERLAAYEFAGELSLGGELRAVHGERPHRFGASRRGDPVPARPAGAVTTPRSAQTPSLRAASSGRARPRRCRARCDAPSRGSDRARSCRR
jgi:magnesium chelatase family protein